MAKEKWIYESKWITFYFAWGFDISYETCGYFDSRHRINLDLIFFNLEIILPISGERDSECDPPKWGIGYHSNTIWIYRGGNGNMGGGNKWWTFRMPWDNDWVRTSVLRKDGKWEHETKGDRKDFYKDLWDEIVWSETYPFIYVLKSGKVQNRLATVKLEEREWKWHWFKWQPFFKKVRRTISVNFNEEVGERSGSWKGGTLGCGYNILPNETPYECLRRMEKDRKL